MRGARGTAPGREETLPLDPGIKESSGAKVPPAFTHTGTLAAEAVGGDLGCLFWVQPPPDALLCGGSGSGSLLPRAHTACKAALTAQDVVPATRVGDPG